MAMRHRNLLKYIILCAFTIGSIPSAGQEKTEHPDWIPARPGVETPDPAESRLTDAAYSVLSQQATSWLPEHQQAAIDGIAEMIAAGTIDADDPVAVDILYKIAGQSFLRTTTPQRNDPVQIRLAAIRLLAKGGTAVESQLLSILSRDPNDAIAAEAAFALREHILDDHSLRILSQRLRRNRHAAPSDRLTYAILLIVYENAIEGPVPDSLVEEVLLTFSGPYVREVRELAARILRILSEW